MANLTIGFKQTGAPELGKSFDDLTNKFKRFDEIATSQALGTPTTAKMQALQDRVGGVKGEIERSITATTIWSKALDMGVPAQSFKQLNDQINATDNALKRTADDAGKLKDNLSGTGGGSTSGGIKPAQQGAAAVSALGALGLPGAPQLSGALRLTDAASKLNESLALTASSATAAALPLAAVGAIFLVLKAQSDANTKAIEKMIEAEDKRLKSLEFTRNAIKNLSEDEARDQLAEANARRADLITVRDDLIAQIGSSLNGMNDLSKGVAGVRDVLGGGEFNKAKEGIGEYNKKIEEQEQAVKDLTAVMQQLHDAEVLVLAQDLGTKLGQSFIDGLKENASNDAEIQNALGGSSEGAQKRRAALLQSIQGNKSTADALEAEIARLEQVITTPVAISDPAQQEAYNALIAQSQTELELYRQALAETNQAVADDTAQAERYKNEVIPVIQAREAESDLLKKTGDQLKDLNKEYEKTGQQIQKLSDQESSLFEDRANKQQIQARKEALSADQQSRQDELQGKIDAAKKGELIKQQHDKETAAFTKQSTALEELNRSFMDSERKRLAEFQRTEEDLKEDHNREMLDLANALNQDLRDLAIQNNVVGFISRSRQGESAISRSARDFGIGAERRADAFALGGEQARDQRNARVTEISQTYRAELNTIRESGKQQVDEVSRLEAQMRDLRVRFSQETAALTAQIEQEEFNKRVSSIRMQRAFLTLEYSGLNQQMSAAALIIGRNVAGQILNGAGQFFGTQNNFNVTQSNNVLVGDIASKRDVEAGMKQTVQGIHKALTFGAIRGL